MGLQLQYTRLSRYQLTDGKIKAQDINGLSAYSWLCWLFAPKTQPHQSGVWDQHGVAAGPTEEISRLWSRSRDALHMRYCKGTSFPQLQEKATWCMVTVTCPFDCRLHPGHSVVPAWITLCDW